MIQKLRVKRLGIRDPHYSSAQNTRQPEGTPGAPKAPGTPGAPKAPGTPGTSDSSVSISKSGERSRFGASGSELAIYMYNTT
jgi:hypothetical protein